MVKRSDGLVILILLFLAAATAGAAGLAVKANAVQFATLATSVIGSGKVGIWAKSADSLPYWRKADGTDIGMTGGGGVALNSFVYSGYRLASYGHAEAAMGMTWTVGIQFQVAIPATLAGGNYYIPLAANGQVYTFSLWNMTAGGAPVATVTPPALVTGPNAFSLAYALAPNVTYALTAWCPTAGMDWYLASGVPNIGGGQPFVDGPNLIIVSPNAYGGSAAESIPTSTSGSYYSPLELSFTVP